MLAVAVMTSCSRTEVVGDAPLLDIQNIEFGSAISASTRTPGSTQFSQDDEIKVICTQAGTAGATTDFTTTAFNKNYKFSTNKFVSSSTVDKWTIGQFHNFYAYYPATLTPTLAADGATIPITVPATTGGYEHDLLGALIENTEAAAAAPSRTGKTAALNFEHRLSKVKFEIKRLPDAPADAALSKLSFTMGNSVGTYNIATGAVELGVKQTVTFTENETIDPITETAQAISGEWIVLPGDAIEEMKFTISGSEYTASKLVNARTEQGKITTITLTYNGDVINFTSSIKAWEELAGSGDLE